MVIFVGVNWREEKIVKLEKYYEMIEEIVEEKMHNTEYVEEFLSNNYAFSDVLDFTEDQKNFVKLEMQEKFKEETIEELKNDGWEIIHL